MCWTRSPRNSVSEPGGANEANTRVSRCAMIRQTGAGGKQALNATSVNSHLFIDCPRPNTQIKTKTKESIFQIQISYYFLQQVISIYFWDGHNVVGNRLDGLLVVRIEYLQ